ncbi:MAG: clostripain-related cysteine peptidase [Fimbriimonas sp.]
MNLNRFALLFLLLVGLFGAGCGGGGGSAPSVLQYITDWTNRSVPGRVTGLSQRVSILDGNGNLISTQVINQSADATQTFNFPSVVAGNYRLRIELYSLANLGGSQTGILETQVRIDGPTSFQTGVGDAIASIQVLPDTPTFRVQNSQRFFAVALSSTNRPTFVVPGDIAWSTLGGVASINSEGIATGTLAGTGSVRATHTPTSLLGATAITVTPLVVTNTKWTVLVYLNAANDLSLFDEANVNQMENVANNPDVRFVVQWKQAAGSWDSNPTFQGTRRYLVKPDTSSSIASELISDMGNSVDMGQSSTLLDFLNWGRTYYPAERYCVVIWNHGNGWRRGVSDLIGRGVSYDDQTGNSIQTWQLAQGLGSFKWDIVAWDASLMQMMEVAYEIKDQAKYVVGSEESPPGEGYPYDAIFGRFSDNPTTSTRDLTKSFVDGMVGDPRYTARKITQSVVDTSKLGPLATALGNLADALILNKSTLTTTIPTIRANAQGYSSTTSRVYRDIVDLCLRLETQRLTITGTPTGGTLKLSVNLGGSTMVTANLKYNATAADVYSALTALANVKPSDVSCTGGPWPSTPIDVTITGQYAGTNVTGLSLNTNGLTGGSSPTLEATPSLPGDIFTASQAVRLAVGDAVVWEGHNAQSANSHGLSIDFASSATFLASSSDYALLSFGKQTSWDEWLKVAP